MKPYSALDKEIELEATQSICPVCLKVIEAKIISRNKAVYMTKTCPEHGTYTSYVWPDEEHYRWMNSFQFPTKKSSSGETEPKQPCPEGCGLCNRHLRHPTLVELEVTRDCNIKCPVCFAAANEDNRHPDPGPDLKTLEEMYQQIKDRVGTYVSIQLTGGEPTTRPDLASIVELGRKAGFSGIEINTNGIVIGKDKAYLEKLHQAGISGIYMQFDGLSPSTYRQIRGADLLPVKLQAIEHCRQVGVQVVLAMTVIHGLNHREIGSVLEFALENNDVIVGLALQPAFTSGRFGINEVQPLTMGDVVFLLAEQSHGLIKPEDLWPLGCSHPLCSCATYLVESREGFIPCTRLLSKEEYLDSFNPASPQGSVFADILAARGFSPDSSGLSILIMNYMDALDLDLKRLRQCSMTVATRDNRLIPFCARHLTSID